MKFKFIMAVIVIAAATAGIRYLMKPSAPQAQKHASNLYERQNQLSSAPASPSAADTEPPAIPADSVAMTQEQAKKISVDILGPRITAPPIPAVTTVAIPVRQPGNGLPADVSMTMRTINDINAINKINQ
jgi:hypothetical protein